MPEVQGLRVLIVEDEPNLLLELENILGDLGVRLITSACRIGPARELANNSEFDLAILDVNLGCSRIDSVAEIIASRSIPIEFATGTGPAALPQTIRGELVDKPYNIALIESAMIRALQQGTA